MLTIMSTVVSTLEVENIDIFLKRANTVRNYLRDLHYSNCLHCLLIIEMNSNATCSQRPWYVFTTFNQGNYADIIKILSAMNLMGNSGRKNVKLK